MAYKDTSLLARYGIAVAGIAAAVLTRLALQPWLGSTFPLATLFTAIAFVVWRAGWGPALFTTVAGWAAANMVFRGGLGFFGGLSFNEVVGFLTYLFATLPIIVLGEAMTRAQRQLQADHVELSTTNLALETKVEAQSLLAAIVASSEDAIVSKTLDGVITSWNRGAERLFGWTAEQAIGQPIHLIVPPDRYAQEHAFLEQLRRGGRIEQIDVERLRKDGTTVHVSITISPVHDRHGLIIGASTTARDVTARKRYEAQLVRSEVAQRLLVEIHDATRGLEDPAMVMREIVTRVGQHFDVTRCAYGEIDVTQHQIDITRGYTKNLPTVAGRYSFEVFGPLMIGELKAGRTAIIGDVTTDPLTDTPTAHETYARMQIRSLVCVPIVRGGRLVAILVMCDSQPRAWAHDDARLLEQVAERTLFAIESARSAQALRENRDVLALAMAVGRMGAFTLDLVTNQIWWSPELGRIMGFSQDDEQTRDAVYALFHEEDVASVIKEVESGIKERRDFSTTFRFYHKVTRELLWLEVNGRATYNADGTPQTLFGLAIDVTERMRAVEALQEADRRKDEFLATLAHELRNPLAPISSGLHILRSAQERTQTSTTLEIMERQLAQMVRLVDDLLDVARITTGKVEIRCQPIDLAEPINDAIETSEPTFKANGQRFIVHRPARPVYINGDRTRLAQVFSNLLNNSAKYSEREQEIALTFEQEGDDAVIRVRDNGIGIHPDMLPRVFEMFRQADRTGGRARGGLGIGLSLVKRILELHGGTVTALSEGPGRGSEFVVRLPAIDAHRVTINGNDLSARSGPPRRRILVVDDNADAAESLAALLAIAGHETRLAHDGHDAVEQAQQFQPDVVFLDIGMPTLDGHETAKLIRQQPWGKNIVLVALTGWGQSEDRRRSKDAGFNHHLVKPADPTVVAKLLASL